MEQNVGRLAFSIGFGYFFLCLIRLNDLGVIY